MRGCLVTPPGSRHLVSMVLSHKPVPKLQTSDAVMRTCLLGVVSMQSIVCINTINLLLKFVLRAIDRGGHNPERAFDGPGLRGQSSSIIAKSWSHSAYCEPT